MLNEQQGGCHRQMSTVMLLIVLYKEGVQHGLQVVVSMFLWNNRLFKDFLHTVDSCLERLATCLVIHHTDALCSRFLIPYHIKTVDDAAHPDGDLSD